MSRKTEDSAASDAAEYAAVHGSHESRDVTFRPIVWAGLGALVFFVLMFVAMRLLLTAYAVREARRSAPANPLTTTYGRQQPPAPRLQTAPVKDLADLRAAEDAVLHSYGWVDRQAGTVRIPIERAMELLEQRGLPSRPASGEQP